MFTNLSRTVLHGTRVDKYFQEREFRSTFGYTNRRRGITRFFFFSFYRIFRTVTRLIAAVDAAAARAIAEKSFKRIRKTRAPIFFYLSVRG